MNLSTRLKILDFQSTTPTSEPSDAATEMLHQLVEMPFVDRVDKNHDARLVREFLGKEQHALYGNSWSYLIQAADCRRWGPEHGYGYRYFDGERMVMIGLFERPHHQGESLHFHVIRPMGDWTLTALESLCLRLRAISGQPVYVKNSRTSSTAASREED
jgi:hypothetical protein